MQAEERQGRDVGEMLGLGESREMAWYGALRTGEGRGQEVGTGKNCFGEGSREVVRVQLKEYALMFCGAEVWKGQKIYVRVVHVVCAVHVARVNCA